MKFDQQNLIILTTFVSFLLVAPSQAANIVDVYSDDLNFITDQNQEDNTLFVTEDYNEDNIVPYPSPNGFAVVDNDSGEPVHWFDKILTILPSDFNRFSIFRLQFNLTNTSPYFWSDYHYEFYNIDFTQKIPINPVQIGQFLEEDEAAFSTTKNGLMSDAIWWIIPENSSSPWGMSVGETWVNWIDFDYIKLVDAGVCQPGGSCQFGIRQIATTHVPESSSTISFFIISVLGVSLTLKSKF